MVIYNITTNGPSTELIIEVINDSVFVEPEAVAYVVGNLQLQADRGSLKDFLLAYFIGKSFFKPRFTGTGKIYMQATIGSYHKFSIKDDHGLILGKHAFIACRDTINLIPRLEVSLRKFLSGTPLATIRAEGNGNLVVHMPGPVQEVKLNNEKFVAFGNDIAAYSDTIDVLRERAGKGWLSIANKMVKVFRGTGSMFFTPNPNKDAKRTPK